MGDYFSTQAVDYSRYRPDYPGVLYEQLLSLVPNRGAAWDCGTGNGQVAKVLAGHFDHVVATDISQSQLAEASAPENVEFAVATAEASGLASASVDLITVGQAIHWFDFERFWQECRRVAKPNAVLAFWTYGLAQAGLPDNFESYFHGEVVGPYWPPGREHVDCLYDSIEVPFPLLLDQTLSLDLQWDLEHYLGYLSSWSATQAYRAKTGEDPIQLAAEKLQTAWSPQERRQIVWPLKLKLYSLGR